MSIVKTSINTIRNLAQLGTEINHVFTRYGHHRGLIMSLPLLLEYYQNMDYDWRMWTPMKQITTNSVPTDYIKTQVPINHMLPAQGTPLGYRMRTSGNNKYPFDMFVISWQPGQHSGIHYHPVFGCSYLVLEGQLLENLYVIDKSGKTTLGLNQEDSKMKKIGWHVHSQGAVGYIDNNIGAHRIINKFSIPAISLHIYSPSGKQLTKHIK
jgi:hypothetical protein